MFCGMVKAFFCAFMMPFALCGRFGRAVHGRLHGDADAVETKF